VTSDRIRIGGLYAVRAAGRLEPVRVEGRVYGGAWVVRNLATGAIRVLDGNGFSALWRPVEWPGLPPEGDGELRFGFAGSCGGVGPVARWGFARSSEAMAAAQAYVMETQTADRKAIVWQYGVGRFPVRIAIVAKDGNRFLDVAFADRARAEVGSAGVPKMSGIRPVGG